jgi:hypothetical protein
LPEDEFELERALMGVAREFEFLRQRAGEPLASPLADDDLEDEGPAPWRPWQAPPGVY